MNFIHTYLYYRRIKKSFWTLGLSFYLLCSQTGLLFSFSAFACSVAFDSISPEQIKSRLILIAENKSQEIQSLNIEQHGFHQFILQSKTGLTFQIEIDPVISKPQILLLPSSKILKIPSVAMFRRKDLDNYLKIWLIGHEIHPYTSPSKVIQYTQVQETAIMAIKQAIRENAQSFLHVAPTSMGKTLVLAEALKAKLSNKAKKISFVTAHQIHLVNQLFLATQRELKDMNILIFNWNEKLNKDFYVEVEKAVSGNKPVIFVITIQSLKNQLSFLKEQKPENYRKLIENTDGIYIDETHHLGALKTRSAILELQKQSRAFLYGSTATPVHHEVYLRDLFEREHWSYLNDKDNYFESHRSEQTIKQLSLGMSKGEIIPFEDIYIVGDSKIFKTSKQYPLFITQNYLRVLNPHHYNRLVEILYPLFTFNKKGFIVTATIAEAHRLSAFLNQAIMGITFEPYHSKMPMKSRQEVLQHSKDLPAHYIVAVRSLDEGVNLPHLSAYIDLNVNVSIKQMVHRIGRVLRLYPGKTGADILFLADYRNAQMAGDLLHLLDIVNVPISQRTKQDFNQETGDVKLNIPNAESLTRKNLLKFRVQLERSARKFFNDLNKRKIPVYEEFIQILKRKNINSEAEWLKQRASDSELRSIPKDLYKAYPKQWKGWFNFHEQVKRKVFSSYEEMTLDLLKDRLLSIAPDKSKKIRNLNINRCGRNCFLFITAGGKEFKIEADPSLSKPNIIFSLSKSKPNWTLKFPSMDWFKGPALDLYIRTWLIEYIGINPLSYFPTDVKKQKTVIYTALDKGKDGLPIIEEAMKNPDPKERILGIHVLNRMNNINLLPFINRVIQDPDPNVRILAIPMIRKIGSNGIPILEKAFNDTFQYIRQLAVLEAGNIGELGLPIIEKAFKDTDLNMREVAVYSAGEIGELGLPIIEKAFKDTDLNMRKVAVYSAGAIGELGLPIIKKAFKDPDINIKASAIKTASNMGEIGWPLVEKAFFRALQKFLDLPATEKALFDFNVISNKEKVAFIIAAGNMGERGWPIIESVKNHFLSNDNDINKSLLLSTIKLSGEKEGEAILEKDLANPNYWLQYIAGAIISKMGAKGISILERVFNNRSEYWIKGMAVIAAGHMGERGWPLIKKAFKDPHYYVQREATTAAGYMGERGLAIVEQAFYLNKQIKHAAVGAVANIGGEKALFVIEKVFTSPNLMVRKSAVEAAEKIGDLGWPLVEKAFKDPHYQIRMMTINIAKNRGGSSGYSIIKQGLNDPHHRVRTTALEVLSTMDKSIIEENKEIIVQLALKDSNKQVRITAVDILLRSIGEQDLDILKQMIKDPEKKVWKSAIDMSLKEGAEGLSMLRKALKQENLDEKVKLYIQKFL